MRARELPAPSAAVAALVAAGAAVCAAEAADPVRQARAALRWAAGAFDRRLVVASSMADGVLAHLASVEAPGVDVLFLDTGYHFAETLAMRDVVAREYPVRMITVLPALTPAEQDAAHGTDLWARDPDQCCAMRKVEPLERSLVGYDAWVTGLRRDDAPTRRDVDVVAWDARRGKVKVNPLARWSDQDVETYAAAHEVPVHPLRERGFASIGCWPCTRPVAPGEHPRAGRWSETGKTECGLHS